MPKSAQVKLWFSLKKRANRIYLNKDWGCVILREIDFLLKICWSIPCLHPSWKVHTWIEICASLNHRKKTKAGGSRLIPRKHTETLVLLSDDKRIILPDRQNTFVHEHWQVSTFRQNLDTDWQCNREGKLWTDRGVLGKTRGSGEQGPKVWKSACDVINCGGISMIRLTDKMGIFWAVNIINKEKSGTAQSSVPYYCFEVIYTRQQNTTEVRIYLIDTN